MRIKRTGVMGYRSAVLFRNLLMTAVLLASLECLMQAQSLREYIYLDGKLIATETTETVPPTVTITSPTPDPTYSTSSGTITLGGTASDNVGVIQVTWANDRGGSGTCSGTISWSCAGITLQSGQNVLTVTALDASGNNGADILTVTYTPPCTYILSPTSRNIGPEGGTGSVGVTAPPGCAWTASSNRSWITITSGSSGNGNGTVNYSVSNNSGPSRSGELTVAGLLFPIAQGEYPQPTCMVITPTSSFAGIDPSNLYFCNGANMTISVYYRFQPWGTYTWWNLQDSAGTTDSNGWIIRDPLPQNTDPGTVSVRRIRNSLRSDWYYLSSPYPQSTIRPPKPTSFAYTPNPQQLPGWRYVSAGNEQDETILEEEADPPNGTIWTYPLPMDASGIWSGYAPCEATPGLYIFRRVRNNLDDTGPDAWLDFVDLPVNLLACP